MSETPADVDVLTSILRTLRLRVRLSRAAMSAGSGRWIPVAGAKRRPSITSVVAVSGSSRELVTLAQLILKEHDEETPGYRAMLERLAEALFIEILRHQMQGAAELGGAA